MNQRLFEQGLKTRRDVLGAGEVFLHTAIYCGVPAAIDSFHAAREVFKEMGV